MDKPTLLLPRIVFGSALSSCTFFVACESSPISAVDQNSDAGAAASVPDSGGTNPGENDAGAEQPRVDCTRIPSVPVAYNVIRGPVTEEDFAFDGEGYLVSADPEGNIVRSTITGDTRLVVPNVSEFLSGMRYLPNGDMVVAASDTNTLQRVTTNGSVTPIISGLKYPNGIEIGRDGFIYVAEQSGARIRRVDPMSGKFEIMARGIPQPNGLSFGPDYRTLYIGTFGPGTIYALSIDENGRPGELRELARTPEAVGPGVSPAEFPSDVEVSDACNRKNAGDSCSVAYYERFALGGTCLESGFANAGLKCEASPVDVSWPSEEEMIAACTGKMNGDTCTLPEYEAIGWDSYCGDWDGIVYCFGLDPNYPSEQEASAACSGKNDGDICTLMYFEEAGIPSACFDFGFGDLFCAEDYPDIYTPCEGKTAGTACTVVWRDETSDGTCESSSFGPPGELGCNASVAAGIRGGLDGMGVDACGYIYALEYDVGLVWRISPDGARVELLFDPPSAWIPNMQWGSGIGGWAENTLYVIARGENLVYSVPLGIPAKGRVYP